MMTTRHPYPARTERKGTRLIWIDPHNRDVILEFAWRVSTTMFFFLIHTIALGVIFRAASISPKSTANLQLGKTVSYYPRFAFVNLTANVPFFLDFAHTILDLNTLQRQHFSKHTVTFPKRSHYKPDQLIRLKIAMRDRTLYAIIHLGLFLRIDRYIAYYHNCCNRMCCYVYNSVHGADSLPVVK